MTTPTPPSAEGKSALEWHCDTCGNTEPIDPGDFAEYEPGDDEPCVHCPPGYMGAAVVRSKEPRR